MSEQSIIGETEVVEAGLRERVERLERELQTYKAAMKPILEFDYQEEWDKGNTTRAMSEAMWRAKDMMRGGSIRGEVKWLHEGEWSVTGKKASVLIDEEGALELRSIMSRYEQLMDRMKEVKGSELVVADPRYMASEAKVREWIRVLEGGKAEGGE